MRHYVAVQDGPNGRWFYANEGRHRESGAYGWTPSGACNPFEACPTCDPWGFRGPAKSSDGCETCGGEGRVRKAQPCEGHATAAEAYEHQKQHLLATDLRFHEDYAETKTLHRCEAEGCTAFTSGSGYVGAYRHWSLCATHRTREAVEPLFFVGESWES